jgi:hypothetical protein
MKSLVITSDCDHLLASEHINILKMFAENEIFITTAVFARVDNEDSWLGRHCSSIDTHGWENKELRKGLIEAQAMGHEIAFHGTSQCSNTRDEFSKGIDEYKNIFGEYPFTYIEHGPNPIFQPHLDSKNELLDHNVADNNPYFIKDIIRNIFSACWTQRFLVSRDDMPKMNKDWLLSHEGITFVKRMRMLDFDYYLKQLKNDKDSVNSFVGYTHFGYEGYFGPNKVKILNLLRILFSSRFEYWKGKNLKKNIQEIKLLLQRESITSLNMRDFVRSCQK